MTDPGGWTEQLAWACLALALLPLILGLINLALLRRPAAPFERHAVSVLIPARDEEANVEACLRAVLAQDGVDLEAVVLDDHSSDATAAIVERLAASDSRLRLERAPPLPPGWNGKQHACWTLSKLARHPVLLFVDADVRLSPGAAAAAAGFLRTARNGPPGRRQGVGLVSGFPRQLTGGGSWNARGEALLVSQILFLLVGYLPMAFMRWSRHLGFGAACGQLVCADKAAYAEVGGHKAIRASRHDGVTLPRAFRAAGFATDLFDATELATCRMYDGFAAAWAGFLKNADEGMAKPVALPVWTLLLGLGHVAPWALLAWALAAGASGVSLWAPLAAVAANLALRLALKARFGQPWAAVWLHPVGVALTLTLQWRALYLKLRGREVAWRGRAGWGPA